MRALPAGVSGLRFHAGVMAAAARLRRRGSPRVGVRDPFFAAVEKSLLIP